MEDNNRVRNDLAHGRLEAAKEIIESTAEEYGDCFDDGDEEQLANALDGIAETMGSLMGAEHVLENVNEEDIIMAGFDKCTPNNSNAFWSEEASMLVGIRGTPSGEAVMGWAYHTYEPTSGRDSTALKDVREQISVNEEPMEVAEADTWIRENNEKVYAESAGLVTGGIDVRGDLYVSTPINVTADDYDVPYGWSTHDEGHGVSFIRDE